ncbi:hypothetical protein DFH07DRAFT_973756 [Mycena maculata]|uniref:Uncharacterized protein n=1 Tax=Mycena maculata TaxID=230809 RepID=A0AAD7HCK4_9AGAR|nr:hypothetical protein DFH07DRAFT_973756 [Mycena maculata]
MPPNAAKELENVTLTGQRKTAVIVGGTLGIGAGVARLLAKIGCSRVIIFGRNEIRGAEVLELLKRLAPSSKIDAAFVQGDLSDSKNMRAAATALQDIAGEDGIDYLVMCQNGVHTGTINNNADECAKSLSFAVQAISRFALAYFLTTGGGLAPNTIVMSICNQGQTLDDLSVDDLSLKNRVATLSKTSLFMTQSKRDSTVLDAVHEVHFHSLCKRAADDDFFEELNIRYPQYRYFSLYPGVVPIFVTSLLRVAL